MASILICRRHSRRCWSSKYLIRRFTEARKPLHPCRISSGHARVQFVRTHIVAVNPLSRERVFAFLLCTETSSPFIETVPVRACVQEQNPKHKRDRGCLAECHCRGANGLSGIGDLSSAAEVAQATLTPAVLLRHEGELLLLAHPAIQIASTNSIGAAA